MARTRARSAESQLRVGRLTKAHGLKGGLKLELFTDDPGRRFVPGASFALQVPEESPWHSRRIELAELRWYNGHPVGFFAGVADREAAESLVKAILWIDQDPAEPAEPDAWYDHQLVGLDVVRDGRVVGTIDRLEHLPAQDLLVVTSGDREVLVPFVRAIVPEVDLDANRVIVTPPAGLFEELPDEPETAGTDAPAEAGEGDAPASDRTAEATGSLDEVPASAEAEANDSTVASAEADATDEPDLDAADGNSRRSAAAVDQPADGRRHDSLADAAVEADQARRAGITVDPGHVDERASA